MKKFGLVFLCFIAVSLLTSCGNKGDLYLPEKEKDASLDEQK
ncbi:MAG: lipoprotein [Gammaproteobacteria bacterium]|nr:lipoprotein [Xanthomonadales bacterium]